jgi:hypothetical protein
VLGGRQRHTQLRITNPRMRHLRRRWRTLEEDSPTCWVISGEFRHEKDLALEVRWLVDGSRPTIRKVPSGLQVATTGSLFGSDEIRQKQRLRLQSSCMMTTGVRVSGGALHRLHTAAREHSRPLPALPIRCPSLGRALCRRQSPCTRQ